MASHDRQPVVVAEPVVRVRRTVLEGRDRFIAMSRGASAASVLHVVLRTVPLETDYYSYSAIVGLLAFIVVRWRLRVRDTVVAVAAPVVLWSSYFALRPRGVEVSSQFRLQHWLFWSVLSMTASLVGALVGSRFRPRG